MLGSSPTGGRNAYVLKTRNDDDSSDELLLKGYDTSLTPQPIQSSTSLSTKSPNISYAISHGEISTPNKDNGLEDGNNTEEISVSRPHGGQTRRSKSKSIGHVTASGLNTWKRKPKGSSLTSNQRVHTITTRKTGLGMGMDSTPARRKKGRAGIGVGVASFKANHMLICPMQNIGLYSTPLATRRRRIEIDQSSSSATISLADPTETPSMTPADVALTSPSWRSTSTIHPLDDPFNMTIPPQVTPSEDQLAEEVTSQTSITAEASSAQVQEMVVPVKFGTSESALTDQSTSSQPIRDSTSGLKLQQETLSHEDFSIPLNDLTQAPGSSMTSQSSDRHLEDEGLTRKTSSKSDLTAKHSKSKTFPSRGTASSHSGEPKRMVDGWSSHGGSSVHGRQSTPYRARGVQRLVDGLGGHDDSGTTNSNSFKTAPETVSLDEVERAERELLEEVEQSRTLDMLWHMDDNQDAPMDQYFDMDVIHNHPEITPPTDLGSEVVEELPSAHSQSEAFQQSYSAEDTRTSSTSDDGQTRAQWHFVRGELNSVFAIEAHPNRRLKSPSTIPSFFSVLSRFLSILFIRHPLLAHFDVDFSTQPLGTGGADCNQHRIGFRR